MTPGRARPLAARSKPKDYDERIYRKGNPPHRVRNALILIVAGRRSGPTWRGRRRSPSSPTSSSTRSSRTRRTSARTRRSGSPASTSARSRASRASVRRSHRELRRATTPMSPSRSTTDGQPIHSDAQVAIRPRIFLEGNFFLDVSPGSPSAHSLSSGGTIPVTQTSTAVQLDQILTSLQASGPREPAEAARGLRHRAHPQAERRRRRDPGPGGPGPDRRARRSTSPSPTGRPAARDSAIVNEALLGTEPHDLSNLIAGQAEDLRRARPGTSPSSRGWSPTSTRSPGPSPRSPRTCSGRSNCSARRCRSPSPRSVTPTPRCPSCGPSPGT